ncbi:MAG: hypothetical protein GVX78_01530 [Bacteroidetes bacterium]|jgi:CXXC-20-CXXC protein|nr:hypothetical protein [Bacteroidota bacterium]
MKCENCNDEFNYLGLLKSFWFGFTNIRCGQCGAIFEHKMFNRILGALTIGLALVITYLTFQDTNIVYSIVGLLSITLLLSLANPFMMKFNQIK